jgi:hypothetical protein
MAKAKKRVKQGKAAAPKAASRATQKKAAPKKEHLLKPAFLLIKTLLQSENLRRRGTLSFLPSDAKHPLPQLKIIKMRGTLGSAAMFTNPERIEMADITGSCCTKKTRGRMM